MSGGSGVDSKLMNDYLKRLEKVEDQSNRNNLNIAEWHPHWV